MAIGMREYLFSCVKNYNAAFYSRETFMNIFNDNEERKYLGQGSYGYCHYFPNLNCVVKSVKFRDKMACVDSLILEIRAMSRLHGIRGVQKICGVCVNLFCLVTEFAGIPLYECYNFKDESHCRKILSVIRDVSIIISRVHARGYSHLDLHPSNILISPTSTTIIDFGFALKHGERHDCVSSSNSNIYFTAPEILHSLPCTTYADVFSIGRIMALIPKNNIMLQMGKYAYDAISQWIHQSQSKRYCDRPKLSHLIRILDKL